MYILEWIGGAINFGESYVFLLSALLVRMRAARLQKLKNEAAKGRFLYWLAEKLSSRPPPPAARGHAIGRGGNRGPSPLRPPPSKRQDTWGVDGWAIYVVYIQAWVGGASLEREKRMRC